MLLCEGKIDEKSIATRFLTLLQSVNNGDSRSKKYRKLWTRRVVWIFESRSII